MRLTCRKADWFHLELEPVSNIAVSPWQQLTNGCGHSIITLLYLCNATIVPLADKLLPYRYTGAGTRRGYAVGRAVAMLKLQPGSVVGLALSGTRHRVS